MNNYVIPKSPEKNISTAKTIELPNSELQSLDEDIAAIAAIRGIPVTNLKPTDNKDLLKDFVEGRSNLQELIKEKTEPRQISETQEDTSQAHLADEKQLMQNKEERAQNAARIAESREISGINKEFKKLEDQEKEMHRKYVALQGKLRDIEKLTTQPDADLNALQTRKTAILVQIAKSKTDIDNHKQLDNEAYEKLYARKQELNKAQTVRQHTELVKQFGTDKQISDLDNTVKLLQQYTESQTNPAEESKSANSKQYAPIKYLIDKWQEAQNEQDELNSKLEYSQNKKTNAEEEKFENVELSPADLASMRANRNKGKSDKTKHTEKKVKPDPNEIPEYTEKDEMADALKAEAIATLNAKLGIKPPVPEKKSNSSNVAPGQKPPVPEKKSTSFFADISKFIHKTNSPAQTYSNKAKLR